MGSRTAPIVLGLVAFMACVSANSSSPAAPTAAGLDRPFTLKSGASASIDVEKLQIGFDRVLSDSRCPRGAQCIVAGEAVLRVWLLKSPAARENRDLKTTPDAEAAYGAYRIKLLTLDPYPSVEGTIRPSDYVATFLVTRV
jgi:hypothetical protein